MTLKPTIHFFSFFICYLALSITAHAGTFTSQVSGDWNVPATWGQATLTPVAGDDVIIDGHQVQLSAGTININSLLITNVSGSGFSQLQVTNFGVLNIAGRFTITAEDIAQNVHCHTKGFGEIHVGGNMIMQRLASNSQSNLLYLTMAGQSVLDVTNNFTFNYLNSGAESGDEIQLNGNINFTVGGNVLFNIENGNAFDVDLLGNATILFQSNLTMNLAGGNELNLSTNGPWLSLTVDNDLILENSGGSTGLLLDMVQGAVSVGNDLTLRSGADGNIVDVNLTNSDASLDLNGSLIIDAPSDADVSFDATLGANFYLGGNIDLSDANKYGSFYMDATSDIYLDGTNSQALSEGDAVTNGTDEIILNNVHIQNSSPGGVNLGGDLTVTGHLSLTNGIVNTSNSSKLTLDDGATIDPGSTTSYINGPMIKRGSTNGSPFTFPVGENGKFAPIGIEAVADPNLEYTAQFLGCPPPVGSINAPLEHINSYGFWTLERSDGDAVGDVVLHWSDADVNGIDHLSSLVVAYYTLATGWHSIGRDNQTGGTGPGVSGSISNDLGCPPPVGGNLFAFGSTNKTKNILPVELTQFKAYIDADQSKVFLEWTTASENNSSHFIIEKSFDGLSFTAIGSVEASGNSTSIQYYNLIDQEPGKGNNYYRIVQIDQDDRMAFSNLVNVFIREETEEPILYPNPVRDYVNVYHESLEGNEVTIKIFNSAGTCVYSNIHSSMDGNILLDVTNLNLKQPGIYFLSLEWLSQSYNLQFLKIPG